MRIELGKLSMVASFTMAVAIAVPAHLNADQELRPSPGRVLPPPLPYLTRDFQRTLQALEVKTEIDCRDFPLDEALKILSDRHDVPIAFDDKSLAAATVSRDAPVTLSAQALPFRQVLNLLLAESGLDWHIATSGLTITTRSASKDALRERLDARLSYEIGIVDWVCDLSPDQSQRLQLACRGDILRMVETLQARKSQLQLSADNLKKAGPLLEEIDAIQRRTESGSFGKGTLFRKTLETTLTPEQSLNYDPIRVVIEAGGDVSTFLEQGETLLGVVLSNIPFTDEGVARLKRLSALQFLQLDGTQVTDASVRDLKELTKLRLLLLGRTKVTSQSASELKIALPGCRILGP